MAPQLWRCSVGGGRGERESTRAVPFSFEETLVVKELFLKQPIHEGRMKAVQS
jgi:hypothetical protein